MSFAQTLREKNLDYYKEIMQGEFSDEFEYWDGMAKFAIVDTKVFYNLQKVRPILKFLADYELRQKSILEVGVALGLVAKAMVASGQITHYVATECGDGYIDYIRQTCGMKVHKAKMNSLPFDGNQFDVVFLFDVLEHIRPEERKDSYEELLRVMREKRQIFINKPSLSNDSFHNVNYDHHFGFAELEQFADFMGCEIRRIEYYKCLGYAENAIPNRYHMIEVTNL